MAGREDVLERLERLERDNRRLRGGLALAAALVLPLALAQCRSGGADVTASRFVVADGEGRTRAVLGLEEGQVRLRLFDEAGGRRASLALSPEGRPGLALFHDAERAAAILEVGEKGAAFSLLDAKANVVFRRP